MRGLCGSDWLRACDALIFANMTLNKILLSLLLFLGFSIFGQTDARIKAARAYVVRNAVFVEPRDEALPLTFGLGRDPETSTTSFVHAIQRNAKRLLTAEQAKRWEALLENSAPTQ